MQGWLLSSSHKEPPYGCCPRLSVPMAAAPRSQSLVDTCAGCPNHPHHGPTAPWEDSLQQERHLPRAKDAGAQEGERQKDLSLRGSSKAGGRSQTTLLSVPVQPRKTEENEGGEGGDLKTFYSAGMFFFFLKVLLEEYSHQLSSYLYNLLTWHNYQRHWRFLLHLTRLPFLFTLRGTNAPLVIKRQEIWYVALQSWCFLTTALPGIQTFVKKMESSHWALLGAEPDPSSLAWKGPEEMCAPHCSLPTDHGHDRVFARLGTQHRASPVQTVIKSLSCGGEILPNKSFPVVRYLFFFWGDIRTLSFANACTSLQREVWTYP